MSQMSFIGYAMALKYIFSPKVKESVTRRAHTTVTITNVTINSVTISHSTFNTVTYTTVNITLLTITTVTPLFSKILLSLYYCH